MIWSFFLIICKCALCLSGHPWQGSFWAQAGLRKRGKQGIIRSKDEEFGGQLKTEWTNLGVGSKKRDALFGGWTGFEMRNGDDVCHHFLLCFKSAANQWIMTGKDCATIFGNEYFGKILKRRLHESTRPLGARCELQAYIFRRWRNLRDSCEVHTWWIAA